MPDIRGGLRTYTMSNENWYIFKRKIKAAVYSIPYLLFRVFPIAPNKIVLWTFEGTGGYGCSPRYIAEELLKQRREGKNSFELYWIVADTSKEFPKEIFI